MVCELCFSLLPFPSDASGSPSSHLHPLRKQCCPVRFSHCHHNFANPHHPLQPEQPQHFSPSWKGSVPSAVSAALPGPCCTSTALLKKLHRYCNPELTYFGVGSFSSHGQPHTVKNLTAVQSSQMLLLQVSSALCSFGVRGKLWLELQA